jgi:tetratricopeptide (TPR) repeat protein
VDNRTKRQLKQHDQFVSLTERGIYWASHNRQSAGMAAIIVVAVIGGIVGGYSWYSHRSAAAADAFGAAMQTYLTPIASPDQQVPPGTKTFSSASDRAKAANPAFVAIAKQYGMTPSGKMAEYFAGLTYMEEGQTASAESALKTTAGSWDNNVSALSKQALAQLYQQTGRDAQAIDLYNQLAKENAATVPTGLARIELAELYQSEGKTDEAKKIFAELKDKDKDAQGQPGPAAEVATEKLNPQPAGQPQLQ